MLSSSLSHFYLTLSPPQIPASDYSSSVTEEPIHIVNIGLKDPNLAHETDEILANKLSSFVDSYLDLLNEKGIRRVTFLIFSEHSYPKYFTFRARNKVGVVRIHRSLVCHQFVEDTIYRHLEPALAFHLEINRLSNFTIQLIPTENHKLHLYLGSAKVQTLYNY